MTVWDFIGKYKELTGIDMERKNMASRLSLMAKNDKSVLYYACKDNPMEYRHWWVLPEWMDGSELRKEYVDKINERMRIGQ